MLGIETIVLIAVDTFILDDGLWHRWGVDRGKEFNTYTIGHGNRSVLVQFKL